VRDMIIIEIYTHYKGTEMLQVYVSVLGRCKSEASRRIILPGQAPPRLRIHTVIRYPAVTELPEPKGFVSLQSFVRISDSYAHGLFCYSYSVGCKGGR
jgi:hypothetical protein